MIGRKNKTNADIYRLTAAMIVFIITLCVVFGIISQYERVDTADAKVSTRSFYYDTTKKTIHFEWECFNSEVTSYRIYRAESGGDSEFIKAVSNTEKLYEENIKENVMYSYWAAAYNSRTQQRSHMCTAVSICIDSTLPFSALEDTAPELSFSRGDDGAYFLNWSVIKNVPITSYRIYKKGSAPNGEWEQIKMVESRITSYSVDVNTEYKVVAFSYINGELIHSKDSNTTKVVDMA